MPNWSKEQLDEYNNRHRLQDTQPQQAVRHDPLVKDQRKAEVPDRAFVRIVSFRKRLLDPDNLVGGAKYLVDGLRTAGLLRDDSPEHIVLQVTQKKVALSTQERTEIEITYER